MLEYRLLGTLEEYVLIKPDVAYAEVYRRSDGWVKRIVQGRDTLQLTSIGIDVPLAEIYRRIPIDFPPAP
jgi:Uma2 family endonuclease